MATLYSEKQVRGNCWVIQFFDGPARRKIKLGRISKRGADTILRHVLALIEAKQLNMTPSPDCQKWLAGLDDKFRMKLSRVGLCESDQRIGETMEQRTLGPFLAQYLKQRTDVKDKTLTHYRQIERELKAYFGEKKELKTITPNQAEAWRIKLLEKFATSTAAKIMKRTKSIMNVAVEARIINENPFAKLKTGNEINKENQAFVSMEDSLKVLKACPDHNWKLIFAFARFCGMRCPSEVTAIRWSDVNWQENYIRIDAIKTGIRYCPIFKIIRPILKAAYDASQKGDNYCVDGYQNNSNLNTPMKRIVIKAGVKPWARLFNNLRATRRTELQDKFPAHVLDAWFGHSSVIAEKHYLQTTAEHFKTASQLTD